MVKSVTPNAISTLLTNPSTDSSSILPEFVVQVVNPQQIGNKYLFSASDGKTKLKVIIPTNQDTEVSSGKTKNLDLIRIVDYILDDIPQTSEKCIIVRKFEHVCAIKNEHTGIRISDDKPLKVYSRRKSDRKMASDNHAEQNKAIGTCLFNNAAVAASNLFKKAAGIDDDVKIVEHSCSRKRLRHSKNDASMGDDVKIEKRTRSRKRLSLFLPEEIIVNILLRLPVRSLLQFKCVCKSWKILITDPQFAKNQFLSSTENPQLVSSHFGLAKCEIISYPLKPLLENRLTIVKPVRPVIFSAGYQIMILGSCNGLLCLYEQSHFKLWNPSLKLESKRSPTIVCFEDYDLTFRGFGYDKVNDRYTVLVVVRNRYNSKEIVTIIYTFGENSWTTVQNFSCDHYCNSNEWEGKFVSGTVNWIVNKDLNSPNQEVIVSFDLDKKTYGEISLPQYDGDNFRNPALHVLSNCICVSFDHPKETHWVVWMMKKYGVVESWTKLKIIPQNKLTPDIHRDTLFVSDNGVILLALETGKLVVYRLNNNGRLNYQKILGNASMNPHIHHESLISPQR
ncbi:putative F-box domain, nucleic acid-binding, F-box associated interaction domain-containing protein [Medicago truncatula]|uniref:F-box protein interaction domain protein n=1 Tax=Medicago truncatula TaxID=3880 RepID=A0A072V7J6_MEDTR|nr:F-box protein interaction domain protein [Medicago truncatula]RHN74192.1 putative F-box domain, nucleic acid-binding, F-box associated interaction domain-containing protein [Medicago truncatula]